MSRIAATLETLKSSGKTALIPYLTAGDPNPEITLPLMHALVTGGADILELGVPFSDPMADGPVIQRACERALEHNVSLRNVLAMVAEFRKTNTETPVVLMGYMNPMEAMGTETFIAAAKQAGVDGVLSVDLPPEESDGFAEGLQANGMDPIYLIAPTSTDKRLADICNKASGFVYYVSLKGVTGAANLDTVEVGKRVNWIRQSTDLPVGVGFGISDGKSAAAVAEHADAVIVGSALIKLLESLDGEAEPTMLKAVEVFAGDIRNALDAVKK